MKDQYEEHEFEIILLDGWDVMATSSPGLDNGSVDLGEEDPLDPFA